jgi:hypothetical protein
MRSHLTRAVALVVAVTAGCAVVASKREYCLFREITETRDVVRLANLYLAYGTEFPDGVYAAELEKMRPEIEREIFVGAGQERGLLWLYVDVFPEGIFANLAREKITQLDQMIRFEAERNEAETAAKQAEVEAAEAARQSLIDAYGSALADWIGIAGLAPYGKDVASLAQESQRFYEIWSTEPLATCDETSCTKHYEVGQWYEVSGGTRENRRLELLVKLVFGDGVLLGYSLTFPQRGVIPLLEELDKVPYDLDQSTLDGATFLVIDTLAQLAGASLPDGREVDSGDALWAWDAPQARVRFLREGDLETGVTDTVTIQLLPPPPPEPGPGKKLKKPKGAPEPPPPPVVDIEELLPGPPHQAAPPSPPAAGETQDGTPPQAPEEVEP